MAKNANTSTVKVGNVTILTAAADVQKLAASVAKRGKTLVNDIHRMSVSGLWHAMKHGDVTPLQGVLKVLRKGHRQPVADWARTFAPIESIGKDGKVTLKKGWKPSEFDLESAAATHFEEFSKDPGLSTTKGQDIIDRLNRVVKAKDTKTSVTTEEARIVAKAAAKAAALALAELKQKAANEAEAEAETEAA